jgi:hypothetical protein
MDILNLHFSELDEDKPDKSKAVIRSFLQTESKLPAGQFLDDMVNLIFLSYQQGYSAGYASGSDYAAGYFDDYEGD